MHQGSQGSEAHHAAFSATSSPGAVARPACLPPSPKSRPGRASRQRSRYQRGGRSSASAPPRDSERPSNSSITARSLDGSSFQMSRDESPSNAECPSRGKGADQSGGASSAVVSKRPVPPDPAVVRAWVGKTRAAQSLLPVINDPVVIAKLVKLFRLAGDERIPR
jgi:hypothetical protein